MGQGCCGGYSGERYAPLLDSAIVPYGAAREYSMRPKMSKRLDEAHHAMDALSHMHDLYRPKASMPYTRPEDGHAAARLNDTIDAKSTSPFAKYRDARILYWNVSGV